MTILSVNETVGSREANLNSTADGLQSSYVRIFQVVADDVVTDLKEIQDLAGSGSPGPDTIPPMFDPYPSDGTSFVNDIDPVEVDGYLVYLVTVTYENPPAGEDEEDPTSRDWNFNTDVVEFQYIPETDLENDQNLVNSAGDGFDPPILDTDYYDVINLSKVFSSWDLATGFDRKNRINSAAFTMLGFVFPVHSVLAVKWVTSGKQEKNDGDFYQLNTQFIFREDVSIVSGGVQTFRPGWLRHVVDRGYNELLNGTRIPILDGGEKKATTVPKLLNGEGGALADNNYLSEYLTFRIKREEDFNLWGLPTTVP